MPTAFDSKYPSRLSSPQQAYFANAELSSSDIVSWFSSDGRLTLNPRNSDAAPFVIFARDFVNLLKCHQSAIYESAKLIEHVKILRATMLTTCVRNISILYSISSVR